MNLEFAGRLNNPDLITKDFKYWVVILKDGGTTLGHSVFILKSNKSVFSEVSQEEMSEFSIVCKWFEEKTKKSIWSRKMELLRYDDERKFCPFSSCTKIFKES